MLDLTVLLYLAEVNIDNTASFIGAIAFNVLSLVYVFFKCQLHAYVSRVSARKAFGYVSEEEVRGSKLWVFLLKVEFGHLLLLTAIPRLSCAILYLVSCI